MAQVIANSVSLTLNGAITSSATSITVTGTIPAALNGTFVIVIDNEILSATWAGSGQVLTVARGQEGTTGAAHATGAPVYVKLTAGALKSLIRPVHYGTATPTGGVSGDVAVGTGVLWANDGGTWKTSALITPASGGGGGSGSGVNKFISPTGNNTTGTGSSAAPWRTIQKFLATAGPGDTLNVRGGTYQGSDIGGIHTHTSLGSPSGTATAPITIQRYLSEVPLFAGAGGTPNSYFWWLDHGTNYYTISGLTFSNWLLTDTGVFTATADTIGGTHHLRWTGMSVAMGDNGTANTHAFYCGGNVRFVEIDHNTVDGVYTVPNHNGCGVEIFHSDGADDVNIHHNFIQRMTTGIQLWDSNSNNITVDHNTVIGCYNMIDMRVGAAGIIVRNNVTGPALNQNLYDPDGVIDAQDHNYIGLSIPGQLLSTGALPAGSPAINGASDGTNAGAF